MAWRTFLALGIVSAVAAAGCTAELKAGGTNDGGADGTNAGSPGTGGGANTGGSKGGAGGGSTGGGGAKSTGGATGSGGGDSGPATCDKTVTDRCQKCINTNCCAELNDCNDARCGGNGSNPG